MKHYIKTVENPENQYKSTPFWSWNDKLDPEMLRWQIQEMKKANVGGYFMHARGGLITEYLGDEWFDCINTCIEEGSKHGLESWCYDEDGWPSGFGGGKVTALGDAYHVRWLEYGIWNQDHPNGPILGLYAVDNQTGTYRWLGTEGTSVSSSPNETIYYVCHNKNQYYVDILNPQVVKAFIESTYEVYYDKIGTKFGSGKMPGFFTDEPQFSNGRTPWSYILPEEFTKRYGYDISHHLICLFLDLQNAEQFRYDFWKAVNDLYTKSFGKQIYDWCIEHDCQWTGHAMCEDNLLAQMRCTAGVMPIYEYMHKPGIDWLGRNIASPIIPRQVSSVAQQLGKQFVLTETFALCGWDVSFEELKWIAEWQYVNGVNSMCQHLEGYSIRGIRKRDYPPSLFYQSPWWEEYKEFNNYFNRLAKCLADGQEPVDVLVLHPMHSAWTAYTDRHNPRIDKLDRDFEWIASNLAGLHIPYHFGDESILANHGSVDGTQLKVGLCSYHTVVIPSMETIDASTYTLLQSFVQNGGRLVSIGDMPNRIDGRTDPRLDTLLAAVDQVPIDDELVLHYFTQNGIKRVSITDRDGERKAIRFCERILQGDSMFFLQNQDRDHSYDVQVKLSGQPQAVRLLLETMEVQALDTQTIGNDLILRLHFEPMQSYIILAGKNLPLPTVPAQDPALLPISLNPEWTIESSDVNCLTLDYVSYSLDNGATFEGPLPVLDVMDKLIHKQYSDGVIFRYTFEICESTDLTAIAEFALVHEYSQSTFQMSLNDRELLGEDASWWLDQTFHKIDIRPYIKHGTNVLTIQGTFYQQQKVYEVLFGENVHETERNKLTYDTEIESIYLIGDFSVYSVSGYTEGPRKALFTDGGFYITNRNTFLQQGELVTQGYPFFRGHIKLTQTVEIENETLFQIKRPFAAAAKLYVNDQWVTDFLWADYTADLANYIKPGQANKISLELVISNRNLLGPHHHPDGECYGVTPHSFGPNGNYSIRNWRDRYCFVKAGIDG